MRKCFFNSRQFGCRRTSFVSQCKCHAQSGKRSRMMVLPLPVLRFFVDTGENEAQNRRRSSSFPRFLRPFSRLFRHGKRAHLGPMPVRHRRTT